MFYNPRFKDVSNSELIRIINSVGQDAAAAQREYNWRNAIRPMRLKN